MTAPTEVCSTCRGTGWLVRNKESRESVVPCPKCRAANRVRGLLVRAEIPPRYLDRGFEVYSTHHPKQEAALKRSVEFVEEFPNTPRGLLLTGPCGVGKTHLSVAMLKTIVMEKLVSGRFVDETELLRRLHYSYDPNSAETEREVLRPLMESDLLVWDDLGTGRPTEWARETMRTVINYRYTYNKHTIFTSNRAVSATAPDPTLSGSERVKGERNLEESVGRRLFSRIMEMCEIVEVAGPDARTEIHKAGRDFRDAGGRGASVARPEGQIVIPTGMIRCPNCQAPRVTQQAVAPQKKTSSGTFLDVSCLCEGCRQQFVARFFPRRGSVEYPQR